MNLLEIEFYLFPSSSPIFRTNPNYLKLSMVGGIILTCLLVGSMLGFTSYAFQNSILICQSTIPIPIWVAHLAQLNEDS